MVKAFVVIVLVSLVAGCIPPAKSGASVFFTFEVENPMDASRRNVPVWLPFDGLIRNEEPDFNPAGVYVIDREAEIASQYVTENDAVFLLLDSMNAGEKRTLTVYYGTTPRNYKKRTQAELSHKVGGEWKNREYIGGRFQPTDRLRVPPEHKDHSWFIRYEGPGWESDKVGYRFYLDQRNAVDVFGKKTSDMVLMGVGQDGFDSYHEMQDWGMDVAKVGKSLGIGSIGMWVDTSAVRVENTDSVTSVVKENGNLTSGVGTLYRGWKTKSDTLDFFSGLSIHAGTRWTKHEIILGKKASNNMCTGIVKDKKAKVFKSEGSESAYGYIATYGKQSLNNDNLGMAVIFKTTDFAGFAEDAFSHVVKLNSGGLGLTYYFGAAWELEPGGITNEADFIKWVERSARELANPVVVTPKFQQ